MDADRELDRVHIRDLRLSCIVGVYEEERLEKQEILINITMFAYLRKACESDRLEDTVDYKSVKKQIIAMVEASSHLLIERLAQRTADICLAAPGVEKVTVAVDKPGALRYARSAAVEITRQ